jgi:hypothetical protein
MAAASHPHSHSLSPRSSEPSLVDTVVGRLLEWVVNSVEDTRARLHRRGASTARMR